MTQAALATNRIYAMDCLEGMKRLRPGSVRLILSDPPYGVTENQWDVPVDLERLWTEYKRVLQPGGAIVLTAQCPFDKQLGMSNRRWLRYEWIWEKSRATGFLNAKRSPLRAHENILVFYERAPVYNPQFAKGRPYLSRTTDHYNRNLGRVVGGVVIDNPGIRYPRTVLRIPSEIQTVHPTQKPVALFEYLIRTYTNQGDLVLDSFMGAGTTAIACLNSGRHFVGFESNPEFCLLAEQRIEKHREALHCLKSQRQLL